MFTRLVEFTAKFGKTKEVLAMSQRLDNSRCKTVLAVAAAVILTACAVSAQTNTAPSTPVVGSPNTVTADPPISRPKMTPCKVQLFSNFMFADFSGNA